MRKRPFRFGLQASAAASGTDWRDIARKTEDLGYAALTIADHYNSPFRGDPPVQELAAAPALAMAAAVTESIRIGTRVFCIDYHLPAVLARTAGTLDLLSDGRFELGLGAGWVKSEYDQIGVQLDPPGRRIDRLTEMIAFIKAYFSGEELSFDGKDVHVHGYRAVPAGSHRPPLMIGGGAKRVLTLAGREADIVSLNFDNLAGVVGPHGVGASTAAITDDRIGWILNGAGDRFDEIELEVAGYFTIVTEKPRDAAAPLADRFGLSVEEMLDHPNALIGPVGELCERIEARRDRHGISYVTVPVGGLEAFAPVVAALAGK